MSLKVAFMFSAFKLTPELPVLSGFTFHLDFTDDSTVTLIGDKVSAITDKVQSIVSSQSDSTKRPTYFSNGGQNNLGFARFESSILTGALIQSTKDHTIFAVRKLAAANLTGAIYIGTDSNGYGIADYVTINSAIKCPGGFMQGVTTLETRGTVSVQNLVEALAISHSTNNNKFYNISGRPYSLVEPTSNPGTPTTGHYIGFIPGQNNFTGDIYEILVYNRQLSLVETNQVMAYLKSKYALPYCSNYTSGGDSITAGQSAVEPYPQVALRTGIASKYFYNNNTAVSGRTSTDVLNGLTAEVLNTYISGINNVYQLMIGHNDLAAGATPANIYTNITSIVSQAKTAGYTVVLSLVLLSTNETGDSAMLSKWTDLNNRIMANTANADVIWNPNLITEAQDPANTTYYQDGIHPTTALDLILGANLSVELLPFL